MRESETVRRAAWAFSHGAMPPDCLSSSGRRNTPAQGAGWISRSGRTGGRRAVVGIDLRTGKRWRNGWHFPPTGQAQASNSRGGPGLRPLAVPAGRGPHHYRRPAAGEGVGAADRTRVEPQPVDDQPGDTAQRHAPAGRRLPLGLPAARCPAALGGGAGFRVADEPAPGCVVVGGVSRVTRIAVVLTGRSKGIGVSYGDGGGLVDPAGGGHAGLGQHRGSGPGDVDLQRSRSPSYT